MAYRQPDISFSLPVSDWRNDIREAVGHRIDSYLSEQGTMLSGNGLEFWIKTGAGGEATYHVRGSTVLLRASPQPPWGIIPKSYDVGITVEGFDKSRLVKELDAQLKEFKILAKV